MGTWSTMVPKQRYQIWPFLARVWGTRKWTLKNLLEWRQYPRQRHPKQPRFLQWLLWARTSNRWDEWFLGLDQQPWRGYLFRNLRRQTNSRNLAQTWTRRRKSCFPNPSILEHHSISTGIEEQWRNRMVIIKDSYLVLNNVPGFSHSFIAVLSVILQSFLHIRFNDASNLEIRKLATHEIQ